MGGKDAQTSIPFIATLELEKNLPHDSIGFQLSVISILNFSYPSLEEAVQKYRLFQLKQI